MDYNLRNFKNKNIKNWFFFANIFVFHKNVIAILNILLDRQIIVYVINWIKNISIV